MKSLYQHPILFFFFVFVMSCQNYLAAHAPDQSYTFLRVFEDHMEGSFHITTDDLNEALGLDLERGITEDELAPYLPQIHEYYLKHAGFSTASGEHPITFTGVDFLDIDLGYYVELLFKLENLSTIPDELIVRNEVLYQEKETHRGLLVIEYNWKAGLHSNEAIVSLTFGPGNEVQTLDLTDGSVWKGFIAMVKSGMWHIYIGLDHILFLLALLLPAVVYRKEEEVQLANNGSLMDNWLPVDRFRPAFIYVLKIVTFFTIAHTITLSLAALQIIVLPSWFVESVIALSIALAALHNIKPLFKNETIIIAFGFGLFHGFGFASVLGDVGLRGEYMTYSLLGFNIGVEVCQVLIICAIFPALYYLRTTKYYKYILFYGSILLILISLYWVVERVFDVDLLLDNYIAKAIRIVKRGIAGLFGFA